LSDSPPDADAFFLGNPAWHESQRLLECRIERGREPWIQRNKYTVSRSVGRGGL
jgi:hypothetical protein